MSESKRIPLAPETSIRLCRSSDGTYGELWNVLRVMPGGEGGSSICYEATHDGRRGRLKEFYPGDMSLNGRDWLFHFERTADHQLRPLGQAMSVRFRQLCDDFLGAYHMLEQAKEHSPNSQLLNNYMPSYEILYGFCSDGMPASVYIWTPDDKQGQNFGDYLTEVRTQPEHLPEHKLYNILNTLITLANCVRVLHEADLLHLDIKPSNFLVLYDASFNINPFTISLFDVNSLYSIYSEFPKITGTPGFRAPEVCEGAASNTSDIYSIGAMLYHAVVISNAAPELYQDGLYTRLDRLVAESRLIQASESHSNIYLRHCLITILRKCLAPNPDDRYDCCEELISDLEKARTCLLPEVFGEELGMHKRLAILDSEPQHDCSPTAVIQELLYQHPLYETADRSDKNINILILGAGTYGQLFLDQALQTGQMLGRRLRIRAMSDSPERDQELYLSTRPALDQFVNVGGSLAGRPDSYGDVDFLPIPGGAFRKDAPAETQSALCKLIQTSDPGTQCHYIFIALGDDGLNQQVAAHCVNILNNRPCSVHYVLRTSQAPEHPPAHPVMISRSLTAEAIDPDLDRMGFNIHLCWESSLNLDIDRAYQTYLQPYYRTSSLACALAIRSKLASVGILETAPTEAARIFQEQIVDERNSKGPASARFRQLVALEHRRWVLEKVTAGWKPIPLVGGKPDYASLARRCNNRDPVELLHPCLAFSTEAAPLEKFTQAMWDNPGDYDSELDELDRMSVELHRTFLASAKQFLRVQPMRRLELQAIRSRLTDAPESVIREFERYQLCLKNILEGNLNYTRQYPEYVSSFKTALRSMDPSVQQAIHTRLKLIEDAIFCIRESNQYVDYKKKDNVLIEKIPFILTYRTAPRMAMVFEDGRLDNGKNSRVFSSVASATVINPSHISYLYCADSQTRVPLLVRKIRSVLNYFSRRSMHCTVSYCIAFAPDVPFAAREDLKGKLARLEQDPRVTGLKYLNPANYEKAVAQILTHLESESPDLFDCSVPLFSSPRNDHRFLSAVTERFPNFEFDWYEKKFLDTRNCSYLTYIEDHSYVRIDDMFALMSAEDKNHYYPEFADVYMDLWKVYSGSAYLSGYYAFYNGANNWNQLCESLNEFTSTNDNVCKFGFPVDEHLPVQTHVFYLPDYMYDALEPILVRLKALGAVLPDSCVTSCNSDACLLTVCTEHDILAPLETLISALYDRGDASGMRVEGFTTRNKTSDGMQTVQVVMVWCDRLTVTDMVMENRFCLDVLKALSDLHLINQYQTRENPTGIGSLVSFRFTSPRMKKLLTTAGEFLEVYTYYDIKKQGYFDDIACSFEFLWETGDITNELDCVLTKGFRSIIIECKSKRELSQDYYYKLSAIAEQFGLNAKKVLIANTYDLRSTGIVEVNNLNRTRGKQLGIITISDPREIRDIGMTLRKILEGKYRQDF